MTAVGKWPLTAVGKWPLTAVGKWPLIAVGKWPLIAVDKWPLTVIDSSWQVAIDNSHHLDKQSLASSLDLEIGQVVLPWASDLDLDEWLWLEQVAIDNSLDLDK